MNKFTQIKNFIIDDWRSNPIRLILETINWLLNFATALIFAVTVPDVPLHVVYPIFFMALTISIYTALSRHSFGLLITSITLLLINIVGYYRLLSL